MESNTVRDPRRWWILAVLCLSLLVLVIDGTVLNLAIPSLGRELGASTSDVQWILDAYVLAMAGLLLTAGSLSDRFGRRLMLVIGLTVFGLASVVAVMSTEPWMLILARALMGVGAAVLMPSTLSILMTVFDEEERRKAMAGWMTVSMVGVILGPTLGGFLLEHFWWGSVFLLNIPVAIIAIIAAFVLMPESKGNEHRRIDPVGVVLSVVGLTSAVYVIIEREWNIPVIALAVVTLGAFIWWERRSDEPMLPLGVFKSRDFSGAASTLLLMSFGMGGVMLILTYYLQYVLGYSPMQAGLAFLPYAIAATVFNGLGATLGKKLSNKTLMVSGLVIISGAFAILALGEGYGAVLASMLVMGVGGGLAGPAGYATIMGAIPLEHAGVGSAMNDTLQQVGMAISIALLGSVLAGVFASNMPAEVPAAVADSIDLSFTRFPAAAEPALGAAMSTGSWVAAALSLAAAVYGAFVLKGRKPAAQDPVTVG
ncbi:MFS transporter [Nonomuraea soli]|uniref:EmrB/QacA subfamily drug resistance transporter n=1 Tax=Nonomuraea soli TaxID=1032476 RepID=A0A7W0CCU4_9ACTN|nr:MFS transporter [Nonomuraea soli]MBA2888677.1 EmrB/QacA subfamily drug resistance transporter [Nonomuraea soli]